MIQNMGCAYAQNCNNILNTGIKIPVSQSSKKQKLRDIQKLKFLSFKFPKKLGGNSK